MNPTQGGSYSEKIAMVIVTGVIIITAGAVAGMVALLYQSKTVGTELPMIASAGFALLAAGMKTSPDTSKQRNPGVSTESIGTVNVGEAAASASEPERRGPVNGP